jgi:hypothetical protein
MRQFVQEESREWGGGLDINVNTITNQNYIELIIALQHKGNWQDWGGRLVSTQLPHEIVLMVALQMESPHETYAAHEDCSRRPSGNLPHASSAGTAAGQGRSLTTIETPRQQ